MAEIYKVPKGVKTRGKDRLNYVAAHHVETKAALAVAADAIEGRAKAILDASRERTGESQIEHTVGDVDHHIWLVDGGNAAIPIEFYGHKSGKAVSPLRKAIAGPVT